MKAHVLLLVVSFVLLPCAGHAAWQPNGTGVAIVSRDQGLPQIVPDGTGGTIIAWSDNRNGDYDIYAQRLNGLGVAQWAPNGVVVCSAPDDQFSPQIVTDGAGGATVMWSDHRFDFYGDIYAQRINGSGVVQWAPNGVAVCTAGSYQDYTAECLVSDGTGGAIIAWLDQRDLNDIYAQRVTGSGVVQWTANGVAVCLDHLEGAYTVVSDAAGGAIIAWEHIKSYWPFERDIYAQRVDGSGVALWTANGVAVCPAASNQQNVETVPDGSGGVIMAWDDHRGGSRDVYAQELDASGVAQWTANGVAVATNTGAQSGLYLVSSAGGAIVAWADNRFGNYDIYAQRVNGSGVLQWSAFGTALCSAPGDQTFHPQYPGIATDGAGGAFVTWQDQRNGDTDVYAQHVSFNGSVQLGQNGAALCTAVGEQDYPAMTYTGPFGDAVVTWEDSRSTDVDVYATPVPNTPIGRFVRYVPYPHGVILIPPTPDVWPVHLSFNNVIAPGFTYLDITPAGPSLPPSFVLGDGRYYNLSTTAGTTDNIEVCIKFDPTALQHPAAALRMFQYSAAGPAGPTWLDVTTGAAAGDSICGTTTSLTTFVIGFPSVTGVGDTPAPASFALNANVPNPFNPVTTIRYDVPAPGADVNISVYDVNGRLVRELVREHRGAGAWSVLWNGEDDRGQQVSSGVYFYRMRAGEFVDTKKMVLLK